MFISKGPKPWIDALFEHVEKTDLGTLLTFDKMKEIAGHDVRKDGIISEVRRKLLSTRNSHVPTKFLSSVAKVGYKITDATEFSNQGIKWKKKAKNAVKKSFQILNTGMTYFENIPATEQNKLLQERSKLGCLTILFKAVENKKVLEATNYQPKITDGAVIKYLIEKSKS
jgi:hypothetical protein